MKKIKYIQKSDYLLAYNIDTLQILKFRSGLREILPSLLPENYNEIEKEFFIEKINDMENKDLSLYLEQLLNKNDVFERNINSHKESLSISFAPIHKCNLKCKYCFAQSGKNYKKSDKAISSKTLDNIIKFIFEIYSPECKNILLSLVSGGEPFLNLDTFEYFLEKLNTKNPDIKNMTFVATNGTIYNDKIKKILCKTKPQLGISIDGCKDKHDSNRVYHNGKGTYNDILRNLSLIQKEPDLSSKTKDFMVMTVLNSRNLDMVNILKHHRSLGASSSQVKLIRSDDESLTITKNNIEQFKSEYQKLYNFLKEEYTKNNLDYLYMITNSTDYFGKFIKRLILCTPHMYRCGAGRDRFSFSADGGIYPCDNFIGNDEYLLGNVNSKVDLSRISDFFKININNSIKCKDCWIRYLCTGDCYYNSLIRTGDMNNPDNIMCELFMFLSELSINLVSELDDINRDVFKKFKRNISIRDRNNFIK